MLKKFPLGGKFERGPVNYLVLTALNSARYCVSFEEKFRSVQAYDAHGDPAERVIAGWPRVM